MSSVGIRFAEFAQQDSGNISYGVRVGKERFFVKTAGRPDDPAPMLSHKERVALLRNAVTLRQRCEHPLLPTLYSVIEGSDWGPLLVYAWADGELLGVPRVERENPASSYQRFRALPASTIISALTTVFDLHVRLEALGYVACDFYDGCFLYDFERATLHLIDLDHYHVGPFINTIGRMFGSARFMAPEEFEKGATIDARTTVFTLGRTLPLFLGDGTLERAAFRGSEAQQAVMVRACQALPADRYPTVAAFGAAWRAAGER